MYLIASIFDTRLPCKCLGCIYGNRSRNISNARFISLILVRSRRQAFFRCSSLEPPPLTPPPLG
ncbi:hypothetical protein DERP_001682 [Dermatophagoides pteronyssinus]|uniref:Uncharacterized protein n=1 Tax=Dermatophagoides pteronyssinus TaxID=6956 RepID=A0ABQ8JB75_DERPT|nr:hypothetical protein DERP_001682 [Dermatophagoides pteronyssinus]